MSTPKKRKTEATGDGAEDEGDAAAAPKKTPAKRSKKPKTSGKGEIKEGDVAGAEDSE